MAQSAVTVTPPSPSPPTNLAAGYVNSNATPPTQAPYPTAGSTTRPPNASYASTVYNDPWHPGVTNVTHPSSNNPSGAATSTVPPFLDDGAATSTVAFGAPSAGPAAEGAGTETVATQTYGSSILVPGSAATYQPTGQTPAWADGAPGGPVRTFSDLGNYVGGSTSINGAHASVVTGAAITLGTNNTASGGGTVSQTVTGTGFTPQSVIYVNGVAQTTTFTSQTSVTAPAVTKKATAGTWPVFVFTPGILSSGTATWTFT